MEPTARQPYPNKQKQVKTWGGSNKKTSPVIPKIKNNKQMKNSNNSEPVIVVGWRVRSLSWFKGSGAYRVFFGLVVAMVRGPDFFRALLTFILGAASFTPGQRRRSTRSPPVRAGSDLLSHDEVPRQAYEAPSSALSKGSWDFRRGVLPLLHLPKQEGEKRGPESRGDGAWEAG